MYDKISHCINGANLLNVCYCSIGFTTQNSHKALALLCSCMLHHVLASAYRTRCTCYTHTRTDVHAKIKTAIIYKRTMRENNYTQNYTFSYRA